MRSNMNDEGEHPPDAGSEANVETTGFSAVSELIAQVPDTETNGPKSLRAAVLAAGPGIRIYLDKGGSWDKLVEAFVKDLGESVNRRSLETYVADFYPAKKSRAAAAAQAQRPSGLASLADVSALIAPSSIVRAVSMPIGTAVPPVVAVARPVTIRSASADSRGHNRWLPPPRPAPKNDG